MAFSFINTFMTSQLTNPSRSLAQWLEYLESIHSQEIDMGLSRSQQVLERLDCQRMAPLTILVGGTNGKGTTSALISQILAAQGLSVGVYSSPHIRKYNERISVAGQYISDADLVDAFIAVEQARGDIPLTYFEFGTLAAFYHFKRTKLDACVLEIGLGGRLDVVNLADADACVVTSIGLDHQNFLGDTKEQIAYEKCSIARPEKPLICGQIDPPVTAQATCRERQGVWFENGRHFSITELDDQTLKFTTEYPRTIEWQLPQAAIPTPNVGSALQLLASVDRLPSLDCVANVVSKLQVSGRLQTVTMGNSKLTFDVGHNPQAAAYLASRYEKFDGILLAMLSDKDVAGVVEALPQTSEYYLAGLDCARGLTSDDLYRKANFTAPTQQFETVTTALDYWGVTHKDSSQHWLVVGSFYTVEAAQLWLEGKLG